MADLADLCWEQLLDDALDAAGLTDRADLARVVAGEMPLELASAAVAEVLAERHALLAAVYAGLAAGLPEGA